MLVLFCAFIVDVDVAVVGFLLNILRSSLQIVSLNTVEIIPITTNHKFYMRKALLEIYSMKEKIMSF